MVNLSDGSAAKPAAGTLGSTDSATGAPQNLPGEAVENEASNFITSFASIATSLMAGQDPHGAPDEGTGGPHSDFEPQLDVTLMAIAKDKAEGVDRPSEDKTKAPLQETVCLWTQEHPALILRCVFVDVEPNDAFNEHCAKCL